MTAVDTACDGALTDSRFEFFGEKEYTLASARNDHSEQVMVEVGWHR
jgi:hypothetical protein